MEKINEDKINKSEADLWDKLYANQKVTPDNKSRYKPLNPGNSTDTKQGASTLNGVYGGYSPTTSLGTGSANRIGDFFLRFKNFFFKKKLVTFSIIALIILIVMGGGFYFVANSKFNFISSMFISGVAYTKNPAMKDTPLNSVVKIIVDKDTDGEASGSGILFSSEGYILTNAHVVTTDLGKNVKSIKVCYSTNNNQGVKCDYDATLIDADMIQDLAVIKVNREMMEVKPYPMIIQEDNESWVKEILPLSSEIKAVGYPEVGGNSITITKGIVSGYKEGEIIYDDGSLQKIPKYIKTDTEINYGNSGGAVFDKNNRYIGISSEISQDDGGKISLVVYWNHINLYLNNLVFNQTIKLPASQYVYRRIPNSEKDLWDGIRAYFRGDYKTAVITLEKYNSIHTNDSRSWNYLCQSYWDSEDLDNLESCAEKIRSINPNAQALSWYRTSYYNSIKENDNNKAYDSIVKAINLSPDFVMLLDRKAELEINLKKYDEAKKTANQISRIDDANERAWYYFGILALKDQDYETGIKYLELSFSLKPDAMVASQIAELYNQKYQESGSSDDLIDALIYNVSAVILDPKQNIGDISNLAGNVAVLFDSDEEGTWASSLKLIGSMLDVLEVDQSLISSLGNVSDDDIRNYLQNSMVDGKKVTQQDIDLSSYYIKMTMAWLYTFIQDKTTCKAQFDDIGRSDFLKIIVDSELDKDVASNLIYRNATLYCLCVNDDYSNDVISSCISNRVNKLFN